jgi:hypothetical protein
MDAEVTNLIERYRRGVAEVEAALAGATDAELDRRDGREWSARMVAHHLADSETNSYLRLRKLLAEDSPAIIGYDEAHYAEVLHYDRPIEASLAVFRAVRASSCELLDRLRPEDLERTGHHSESGPYSVRTWLEIYASHAEEHASQIRRARRATPVAAAG